MAGKLDAASSQYRHSVASVLTSFLLLRKDLRRYVRGKQNDKERITDMNKMRTRKTTVEKARVKFGKLPRQDRELKNGEAKYIRGGGGKGGAIGETIGIRNKLGR